MPKGSDIIVYQAKNGALELREDLGTETIWATQAQIAEIFDVERSVVTKHVGKIFSDNEIDKKSNVQKMHIANSDKPVAFYSLDVILAVGYRSNSARAIQFQQWATKTLHSHIVDGYTINPARIDKNYQAFLKAVEDVKKLLPAGNEIKASDALELIKLFADTLFSFFTYHQRKFLDQRNKVFPYNFRINALPN